MFGFGRNSHDFHERAHSPEPSAMTKEKMIMNKFSCGLPLAWQGAETGAKNVYALCNGKMNTGALHIFISRIL